MKDIKIIESVLLKKIKQLKLGSSKLRLDLVLLSRHTYIDVRIRAGEKEKLVVEEYRRIYGEVMGIGAEDAGNGKPYLSVLRIYYGHFALAAGAFQLDHIRAQREKPDYAHNPRAAMRTTVRHSGLFQIKYHILSS